MGQTETAIVRPIEIRRVLSALPGPIAAAPDAVTLPDEDLMICYELAEPDLVITSGASALARPNSVGGWEIILMLSPDDAATFEAITEDAARQLPPMNQLALVVDQRIVSAPTVSEPIAGAEIVMTGDFDESDAEQLVEMLTTDPTTSPPPADCSGVTAPPMPTPSG